MARCEEGYRCDVCGDEVEEIVDSALYLHYVIGDVPPERLLKSKERHIRCEPSLAQFIVDSAFPPAVCTDPFAKANLDAAFVKEEEARVTRGWRRLQQLPTLGLAVPEYPLPEVIAAWGRAQERAS